MRVVVLHVIQPPVLIVNRERCGNAPGDIVPGYSPPTVSLKYDEKEGYYDITRLTDGLHPMPFVLFRNRYNSMIQHALLPDEWQTIFVHHATSPEHGPRLAIG